MDPTGANSNLAESRVKIAVEIPRALREYCGGASALSVPAATVQAALNQLEQDHPALYSSICDETGAVRRHINLFLNSNLMRSRGPDELGTALAPGDVLAIFPAVSGG
ncbi:MAG TPA: MoaD/ThiS family protein [Pirellulaceae bacterium]